MQKSRIRATGFIAPVALMGYGFIDAHNNGALKQLDVSTKDELQEDHPRFAAHVDDYAQFAQVLAVFALNLSGVKGKHNLFDASMLYATSAAIMGLSTHFVKQGEHRLRPDGLGYNFFHRDIPPRHLRQLSSFVRNIGTSVHGMVMQGILSLLLLEH